MYYVVRALSPYTEYEFYVIAVNNIGRGPPSAPATCTTGETSKYRYESWRKLTIFLANKKPTNAVYFSSSLLSLSLLLLKRLSLYAAAWLRLQKDIFQNIPYNFMQFFIFLLISLRFACAVLTRFRYALSFPLVLSCFRSLVRFLSHALRILGDFSFGGTSKYVFSIFSSSSSFFGGKQNLMAKTISITILEAAHSHNIRERNSS